MKPLYDKYLYVIARPWSVKMVYLLGIAAWLLTAYGFMLFASMNIVYFIIMAPFVALFTAHYLLSYGINLFYKPFKLNDHKRKVATYWETLKAKGPTVDILITACGEPVDLVSQTILGATRIEYNNKRIVVLDDKGDIELERFAKKHGAVYLSRPNKGEMKKAGNLQYGLQHSTAEFFVVFDADFVPHPDFIKDLLPYTEDSGVGIVQSPQYFQADAEMHGRSKIAFGAAHVQEDFYRVIQPSRDVLGGAVCVGSNAIYRRSAINKIGGIPQVEHSEDIECGLLMVENGFQVKYIPLILSIGLCPEDLHTYFQQQHRWCTGSLRLMSSARFWNSKSTLAQKLCYISGFLYYVAHALVPVFALQIFAVYLLHASEITVAGGLVYYPFIIFSFILLPYGFRLVKPRFGSHIIRQVHYYFFGHALATHTSNNVMEWHPSGSQMKMIGGDFLRVVWYKTLYIGLYLGLTLYGVFLYGFPILDLRYTPVLLWIVYANIVHLLLFVYLIQEVYAQKKMPVWQPFAMQFSVAGAAVVTLLFLGMTVPKLQVNSDVTAIAQVVSADEGTTEQIDTEPVGDDLPIEVVDLAEKAPTTPSAEAEAPAETVNNEVIEIAVQKGDSHTIVARQAILQYEKLKGTILADWQVVYMETTLSQSMKHTPLKAGTVQSYDVAALDALVSASDDLYASQIKKWSAYAKTTNISYLH